MKKIVRLTESDLVRIVKRVINEQAKPVLIDGQAWIWVGTDTQSYQGKKAAVEMKHSPPKGATQLPNKTWIVGCDSSITPKPMSGGQHLIGIAKNSLTC